MVGFDNTTLFNEPNPFGVCILSHIESFEKEFSVKLPNDYKEYLCEFNGSKPINTICCLGAGGETSIHHMYGLHNCNEYKVKIKAGMFIFADDNFGNKFSINLNGGKNYGCIYFVDTEEGGLTLISENFNSFILSLIPKDVYMDHLKNEDPEVYARILAFKQKPQI